MEIDKRQKRMLIVLSVVLSYAAFELITNSEQYFGYYMNSSDDTQQQTVQQAAVVQPVEKKPGVNQYEKDWGDDPFFIKVVKKRRSSRRARSAVKMNLSAISFGGGQPVARKSWEILFCLVLSEYLLKPPVM